MDTRSRSTESTEEVGEGHRVKRSRPFVAWLSFFLGLAIVGGCLLSAGALVLAGGQRLDALKAPFMDYRNTSFFRERTRYYFSMLLTLANDHSREGANEPFWNRGCVSQMLKDEGKNLLYGIVVEAAGGKADGGEVASGDGTAGEGTSGDGTGAETTGSDATDGGGGPWSFGNIDGGLASIMGLDNMPVLLTYPERQHRHRRKTGPCGSPGAPGSQRCPRRRPLRTLQLLWGTKGLVFGRTCRPVFLSGRHHSHCLRDSRTQGETHLRIQDGFMVGQALV